MRQPMQWLTTGFIGVVALLALSASQPVAGYGLQPAPVAQRGTPSPVAGPLQIPAVTPSPAAGLSGTQVATSVPSGTTLPPGGLPGSPVATPSRVASRPVGAGATATPVATSTTGPVSSASNTCAA